MEIMQVWIEKAPGRTGTRLVMVDDEEWGQFEAHWHGPQGNSYTLHDCTGSAVRDQETRQTLRVHGDKLTARLTLERPWHRPDLTIEQRLLEAAEYAILKQWLDNPVLRRARQHADWLNAKRKREAEEEQERRRDVGVGMRIANEVFPTLGDQCIHVSTKMELAEKIADAIKKGRSE